MIKPLYQLGAAFATATIITTPLAAHDLPGFYIGGDISAFEAEFDYVPVMITGDGLAYGVHVGYRHMIDLNFFVEGEVFAQLLNGETNNGNTDLESYYGLTVGAGTYFEPGVISAVAFGGLAQVRSDNTSAGLQTDGGYLLGMGLGYDITLQNTVSIRYTRVILDGTFGNMDTDIIGLRFSHRF